MEENDIIVINGKRYISAKKACEMTGYSKDYIGQLCRAGKFPGRVFKHKRFVEEDALFEHAQKVGGIEIRKNKNSIFDRVKSYLLNFRKKKFVTPPPSYK